jgi:signal-transduction protein with cAMP-binding, CBS, and nucleotidyltransferase domain
MIEESLIESARVIKKEFLSLNKLLEGYEHDVRILASYFIKTSKELKDIVDKSKNDSISSIKDKVMLKLNELELESDRICSKINKINENLEKLKKEEMDLFLVIQKRHPTLSNDEIKIEVQKRI